MRQNLRINGARLLSRLQRLAQEGARPDGGVCRLALSDADKAGRDLVVQWMRELGLAVSIDAIGNVVGVRARPGGRRAGDDGQPHRHRARPAGATTARSACSPGSRSSQTLDDAGIVTKRPLAVAFFTNEEGARFQPDMFGSLVFTGAMPLETRARTVGIDGAVAGEELKRIGYRGAAPVGQPNVHAYVELHVEQGPTLEAEGLTIGAVEGVQGISWTEFTLTGQSNHAGTTPMRMRRDAGYVAAAIAVFARQLAQELGGHQVATVGALTLTPNLVNVVAERALMTVDLRNTDNERLKEAERRLRRSPPKTAAGEGVTLETRTLARFDPVAFAPHLVARVEAIAKEFELPVKRLPSGAGHDAQMLAAVCPACMIFMPSAGGVSHNIAEYTKPDDLAAGADVLLRLVAELAE